MKPIMFAALLAFAFQSAGCLPILVPRKVMTQPEGTVRVVSKETAAPLSEASVTVARYHVAPTPTEDEEEPLQRWTISSNEEGEAHFTFESKREWVMPLMMHGVPFRAWVVCAAAEDHIPKLMRWHDESNDDAAKRIQSGQESLPTLLIELEPGSGETCEERFTTNPMYRELD